MALVGRLVEAAVELSRSRSRVLIGIDGPDAAGKTTLADRLAAALPAPVIRASIDSFHQPRELRYARGERSADGYYLDSFDYDTLLDGCLRPFRDGATRLAVTSYDHRADAPRPREVDVPTRAVLVFDGVFLLRETVRDLWTLSIYLRVSPEETLRRAVVRDLQLFGSASETERRYGQRYLPGQARYRADADPERVADVVVDNERPDHPTITRWAVAA